MKTKKCSRCKKILSLSRFSNTSNGGKVYKHTRCKMCINKGRVESNKRRGYNKYFYPSKV